MARPENGASEIRPMIINGNLEANITAGPVIQLAGYRSGNQLSRIWQNEGRHYHKIAQLINEGDFN